LELAELLGAWERDGDGEQSQPSGLGQGVGEMHEGRDRVGSLISKPVSRGDPEQIGAIQKYS
jgi:hypothetical protein